MNGPNRGAGTLHFVRPPPDRRRISVAVLSKIPNLQNQLKATVPHVNFHEITTDTDERFTKAEVIIGDCDLLAPFLYKLPETKWIQGTWAGVDKIMRLIDKEKPLPFTITRFSGESFGRMMGEYIIFHIVNHERQMQQIQTNQTSKIWSTEGAISNYRAISDLSIGILGVGVIGDWIGRTLHRFGGKIYGLGKKPTLNLNEVNYFTYYYTKAKITEFLKHCDYIVNILPDTPETAGMLNGGVLESCKERKPTFINIGRASIVSESVLIEAINNNWISAAILDVFQDEPLPEDSPLWTMPQVTITPHVAGCSRAKDIAEQFRKNIDCYRRSQPIPLTLDINRGY